MFLREDDKYILWLSIFEGLSALKKFDLYKYFESAKAVYEANLSELLSTGFLTEYASQKLIDYKNSNNVENTIEQCLKKEIEFISIENNKYPQKLLKISDPPLGLFIIGTLPDYSLPNIAIVGSRACSKYGASQAYSFANHFASNGMTIVSGLAKGIDAKAHLGAIDANGKTIAVLGNGVDVIYPSENIEIREKIIETGCIISEYAPGVMPLRCHFPIRNRIISGLSDAVCVIEATKKSGSLHTINHALEQGKEVFSVPGNITSALSIGCNDLIKSGAHPLTDPFDLYEVMDFVVKKETKRKEKNISKTKKNTKINKKEDNNKKSSKDNYKNNNDSLAADEKMVYDCIGFEPVTVEKLAELTNSQIQTIQYILIMLELKSYIVKLPGQKYVRSL